jgi:hypothetical protein
VLRYQRGLFLPEKGMSSLERVAADQKAEDVYLKLMAKFKARWQRLSAVKQSNNFAPSIFAKDSDADGVKRADFEDAMNRLLNDNKIRVEEYGPPSNRHHRLAVAGNGGAA